MSYLGPTALIALPFLALSAFMVPAAARAAGIERIVPSVRPLFRSTNYAEFNLAYVSPRLQGRNAVLPVPGIGPVPFRGSTTDLFDDYAQFSFFLKGKLTDRLSYGVVLDEPWGSDTNYPQGSFPEAPGFSYEGTTADLRSYVLTTMLAYDMTPNIKIYAGVRAQRTDAEANIPFVGGYSVTTDRDWGVGWMVGAGYQVPAIALNVSLTYYSAIDHDFDTSEFVGGLGPFGTEASFETPQAVNLEFQSGIAAKTLVFGSVRWTDWSKFSISPELYPQNPLVDYEADWWTYNIGIGRALSDDWSGALQFSYEPSEGGTLTTLGPTDGRKVVGGSITYSASGVEWSGGISYGWLGETENQLQTRYEGGDFTALGLRIGYSF